MKRALSITAAATVLLLLSGVGQVAAETPDLATLAAGRIRFLDGNGARMTLGDTTVTPDLDYLVLVGATFRTGNGRLELQTLNGDLFWMDSGTDFHFEASDPDGDGTTLFLGRGSMVVKTAAPFALVTGAGTLLVPAGGTYSIDKADPGKQRTRVATVAGPEPEVLSHATLFSKFSLGGEGDAGMLAWVARREQDWQRTLVRAGNSSYVDRLPPMVAYEGPDGGRQWRRVAHAGPLPWLTGWLRDDLWVGGYDVGLLRAAGVLPAGLDHRSSFETWLWFLTNRYNSLRWAWSVPLGWHAEWYWDPLAGFDAQFGTSPEHFPAFQRCGLAFTAVPYWDWYVNWAWEGGNCLAQVSLHRGAAVSPGARPVLGGVIPERAGKHARVRLVDDARLRDRLRTDPALRSIGRARSLDPQRVQLMREHGGGGSAADGGRLTSRAGAPTRVTRTTRAVSAPVQVAVPRPTLAPTDQR